MKSNMGPLISEAQLEKVLQYVKIGVENGAKLLIGGSRLYNDKDDDNKKIKNGYYMEPTVLLAPPLHNNNNSKQNPIITDEIFGPVMTVIPFNDEAMVINEANNTNY